MIPYYLSAFVFILSFFLYYVERAVRLFSRFVVSHERLSLSAKYAVEQLKNLNVTTSKESSAYVFPSGTTPEEIDAFVRLAAELHSKNSKVRGG